VVVPCVGRVHGAVGVAPRIGCSGIGCHRGDIPARIGANRGGRGDGGRRKRIDCDGRVGGLGRANVVVNNRIVVAAAVGRRQSRRGVAGTGRAPDGLIALVVAIEGRIVVRSV